MTEFLYSVTPPVSKPAPKVLPKPLLPPISGPMGYLPDEGLVDAVNVALLLRQPLLLTGEPGTGKSQLAASVAYQLGLEAPFEFETKSTSVSRDLFYYYDYLSRFRMANGSEADKPAVEFITYHALGAAIIHGNTLDSVQSVLPRKFDFGAQRRSVVLIDEIDKAPRDFPNDILNEIERMFFRITELEGATVGVPDEFRPVVIMTSNSEKSLPDAFLRRCIFYNIPFPNAKRLEQIVVSRLGDLISSDSLLLSEAMAFFLALREADTGLRRPPGTAELLNWLSALLEFGCRTNEALKSQAELVSKALSTLSKIQEDQARLRQLFLDWSK